jgi:hypothetical protein
MIGLSLEDAKTALKAELGVTRMGSKRFLKELESRGLVLLGGVVCGGDSSSEDAPPPEKTPKEDRQVSLLEVKKPHPVEVQLDESLRRSDLPLQGDLYYYKGYEGGVVQGEVIRSYCFAEMLNPNGTWQTVLFQDLSLTKKGVGTPVDLRGYYEDNRQLKLELERLKKELEALKSSLDD